MWFCSSSVARAAPADAHKEGTSVGPCAEPGLLPLAPPEPALHCGMQVRCGVYHGLHPAYAQQISSGFLGLYPFPDWHEGSGGAALAQ